ncbi:MAG: PAS domain-containing protein [Syntrophotaleaceae bacterium]
MKRIVSSTPDLVALVDRGYVYRVVNDSYLRAFGMEREEIVGKTVAELLGEDNFSQYVKPHLQQAFSGETISYERWINFPASGRRLCTITFHPISANGSPSSTSQPTSATSPNANWPWTIAKESSTHPWT